jgi:glyoxylase-like metal-dependent hydrolase (beta-lactamase superfamily II)
MTQPKEIARELDEVLPGLFHWRIHNSNIGGAISSSHALCTADACVFVDPVRLDDHLLAELPTPTTVALTARCHQRAAWTYRLDYGVEVWLPRDAVFPAEEPDRRYAAGDELPGGLRAIHTPGPETPHYSLLWPQGPGVLFCPDLVMADDEGRLAFVPPQYHQDPEETHRSVERLLGEPFSILCLAHGAPLVDDPKAALRALLAACG